MPGQELPPARHPADLPWWHGRHANVRAWARTRQRSRATIGVYGGAFFAIGKLAISWIEAAWRDASTATAWRVFSDPGVWTEALVTAIIFGCLFGTIMWRVAERNYLAAVARREEYDSALRQQER